MKAQQKDKLTPNPGSDAAIKLGCKCPVKDNAAGQGCPVNSTPDDAYFWIELECPLHWHPLPWKVV